MYTMPIVDFACIYCVPQKMDLNRDGVISIEEFMDTCRKVGTF